MAAIQANLLRAIRWPQEDNKIPREIFTDPDLFRVEMDSIFRDIVVFADGVARFKTKTVILDNPVLQDVFVYPL